jgi:serine/threonine protein kinase
MPDDRYEIRGKIGQGGVGAVYRAWDTRLSRDVAIKRVLPEGGYENEDEAIENLLKEATSLSAVQHPHIVTVFDAGVDEEGPYVVMELLTGRTIDEMIERGSLILEDFREVAVQTQEALIAAQDLDLVHRDLKPTNVMVTWLPSGKFQVKLVDFGLAKFHPKPSVQTIDHGDAVFGSIHFMAPEQFERTPLDQRTDMYAIGCLYYFCLTGLYPFHGETAPEVMTAHLQHHVTPLAELRPDLPSWVCDWVMWHIAREMADRPASARDALQHFLQMEQGIDGAPEVRTAPQFVFSEDQQIRTPLPATPPTTAVVAHHSATPTTGVVMTKTTPQPLAPPKGRKPSIHTTSHVTTSNPLPDQPEKQPAPNEATAQNPEPAQTPTPASSPPPGARISLRNPTAQPLPPPPAKPAPPATVALPTAPAATPAPASPANTVITSETTVPTKSGLGMGAKISIGVILTMIIVFVGSLVLNKIKTNNRNKHLTELLAPLADPEARDLPLNKADAALLLKRASTLGVDTDRQAIYQCLSLSKSSDGSDLDAQIASYAANASIAMSDDLRMNLFKVIRSRKGPSAFPYLIDFAKGSTNTAMATAALQAAETLATERDVSALLGIIQFNDNSQIQQAAESAIASLARRSDSREFLSRPLLTLYDSPPSDEVRLIYLRLLGAAGGEGASAIIIKELSSEDPKNQLASIAAMKVWPDDSMFENLVNFFSGAEEGLARAQAFGAAFSFLKLDRQREAQATETMWTTLAHKAGTRREKIQVINGLALIKADWALTRVLEFEKDGDDQVSHRAEQAIEHITERNKGQETSGNEEE